MLLLLGAISTALAGDVLINEVLYNPTGSDGSSEWIELCNAGTDTVDLTGLEIQAGGSSFSTKYTVPSGTLGPGDYVLIGAGSADYPDVFSGSFQNGGSETDGIRLVDSGGEVLDTLLYDSPNTNELADDATDPGESFAPEASEGNTLGRYPDCADTDLSGDDFIEMATPTPGDENEYGAGGDGGDTGSDTGGGDGGTGACELGDGIVINEFLSDPTGADGDSLGEYVELFNAGDADVDLGNWEMAYGTSSFSKGVEIPEGTVIAAGGFLVIGDANVSNVDVASGGTLGLGNAGSSADGLQLVDCAGTVMDTVIYGDENSDGFFDDNDDVATSLAPAPGEGATSGRFPDGVDTDLSADDFITFETPSPGYENGLIEDCDGQDDIKLNEALTDSDAEGGDSGNEWIEIYNAGSAAVDMTGWSVQFGKSGSYSGSIGFPDATTLQPGDFYVIGGELVVGADLYADGDAGDTEVDLGNGSSGDAIRLVHCGGGPADVLVYGGSNEDGWLDESGETVVSPADNPGAGETIARCVDGEDTDVNGTDWVVSDAPSMGSANPECVPKVCEAGADTIKINELLPDPSSTDSGYEFLELYNAGDATVRLDDWVIEAASSSWSEKVVFLGGVEIAAGEFLVIGEEYVPDADVYDSLGLGNAGTGPDGVRLIDCEGTLQDTVLYADEDAELEDELYDDQGAQTVAIMPSSNASVGRYPDGVDTDDNAADFLSEMEPTPGSANREGSTASTDGGGGGGGGCGKTADGSTTDKGCSKSADGSGGKCSVVGLGGTEWLLVALLAGLRRRRDG